MPTTTGIRNGAATFAAQQTAMIASTMSAVSADLWRRGGGSRLSFATKKRRLEFEERLQTPSCWISKRSVLLVLACFVLDLFAALLNILAGAFDSVAARKQRE